MSAFLAECQTFYRGYRFSAPMLWDNQRFSSDWRSVPAGAWELMPR
ncbi:Uncharacterised protein [Yokenella regensburgei]|uniref:Uncharacterized protein n=1 Tax=Yokenella regensburgei TaxID=158877 RepID=A0AB38FQP0_9ENTR|nr:Uncharacterised protein [Yokenella regensburgei]SQA67824.1 Uncharacterised protein [Yokenella regensburgei]SUQ06136.1 Uncharacterised protein [Yokenella regensburgei]